MKNSGSELIISGDPHQGIGKPGSPRRKAVDSAFKACVFLGIQRNCIGMMHTGDECDGPLNAPTLDNWALKELSRVVRKGREHGLKFFQSPLGNHSVPKHRWQEYPNIWNAVVSPDSFEDLPVYLLDFQPAGQEAAENAFNVMCESIKPAGQHKHVLVVAHMLWDGTHIYTANSQPTHENWFREPWCSALKRRVERQGYKTVTIILGHDHVPANRTIDGVEVFTIGSPTAMTYGDDHPRRFLTFNFETGAITQIDIPIYLKQLKIKSLEEAEKLDMESLVREGYRFQLDISADNQEDLERAKKLDEELRSLGAEVKNTVTIIQTESVKKALPTALKKLLPAWEEFCEGESAAVIAMGSHFLSGVANEVHN